MSDVHGAFHKADLLTRVEGLLNVMVRHILRVVEFVVEVPASILLVLDWQATKPDYYRWQFASNSYCRHANRTQTEHSQGQKIM